MPRLHKTGLSGSPASQENKASWENPSFAVWEDPSFRRIGANEAETGIFFGPEILILLS